MPANDVYHSGEIAVQERTGDRSLAARRASMIGDRLGGAAREFLRQQRVAAVGGAAPDGSLWASLWCGVPGYLRCDERGQRVAVDSALDCSNDDDPVRPLVAAGAPLGMLAIDFVSRQRLRINGAVSRVDAFGFELCVREAFGNCIKYIQRRELSVQQSASAIARVENGRTLDAERLEFISRADTLFVTSIHAERGLDVSHRGGEPGFVSVARERTLLIPDYTGNGMYQTFGNFEVDSRAGLALIDFERRRVLSLTGNATCVFDAENPKYPTGGTGRYWSFMVQRWMEFSLPPMMTWTLIERSPFNPHLGDP